MKSSARYEMDMCSGSIFGKMLRFALPLMLTGILQLLFNAADVAVVGKFGDKQALAAVSSTGSLTNLLVNVFMGMSVGASVAVARHYGEHDVKAVSQSVHTAITLACIGSVIALVIGVTLARPLLVMMSSPEDVLDGAALYMRIYFLGMPVNMLYTFGSAILRAVGDTKRPLYFLMIAGVINVCLNLLLVIVFHMGVAGVALATVVSQGVSAVLVLRCLLHTDSSIRLDIRRLRIHRDKLFEILRVGLPAGVQGSLFSISNVLIQSAINSFGTVAVAGNGIASNLEGFIYTSMNAVFQSNQTFTSQNMGAKKPERIGRIMLSGVGLVSVIGLSLGTVMYLLGPQLLSIYTPDPEVIQMGLRRVSVIAFTYFMCGIMDVMVGQLRGMGYSMLPMTVSLLGACAFRVVWLYTFFAANRTLETLYLSYPISWGVTAAFHIACYFVVRKKVLARLREG